MIEIRHCSTEADFSSALQLTRDYIDWLEMDLSFQEIEKEFEVFSSMYGSPGGLFLLARHAGDIAGGVGYRTIGPGICEMKRLYVYDRFKGLGIGRRLCVALIREAENSGFKKMRLDTLERMPAARGLYRSLGFREIAPYCYNPDPTTKYMELDLSTEQPG